MNTAASRPLEPGPQIRGRVMDRSPPPRGTYTAPAGLHSVVTGDHLSMGMFLNYYLTSGLTRWPEPRKHKASTELTVSQDVLGEQKGHRPHFAAYTRVGAGTSASSLLPAEPLQASGAPPWLFTPPPPGPHLGSSPPALDSLLLCLPPCCPSHTFARGQTLGQGIIVTPAATGEPPRPSLAASRPPLSGPPACLPLPPFLPRCCLAVPS